MKLSEPKAVCVFCLLSSPSVPLHFFNIFLKLWWELTSAETGGLMTL